VIFAHLAEPTSDKRLPSASLDSSHEATLGHFYEPHAYNRLNSPICNFRSSSTFPIQNDRVDETLEMTELLTFDPPQDRTGQKAYSSIEHGGLAQCTHLDDAATIIDQDLHKIHNYKQNTSSDENGQNWSNHKDLSLTRDSETNFDIIEITRCSCGSLPSPSPAQNQCELRSYGEGLQGAGKGRV